VSEKGIGVPAVTGDAIEGNASVSANQNRFGFRAIESQAVVTKPTVQSRQAVGK